MITITKNPPALLFSQQPVFFEVQSDVALGGYRISGAVDNIGNDSIQPDAQRKAAFNFAEYVQNLNAEPAELVSQPSRISELPSVVTFSFVELFDDPNTMELPVSTGEFYVLDGKVPDFRKKDFYNVHSSILSYLVSSKSWLTWYPYNAGKKIMPSQKDFLKYLHVSQTTMDLQINVVLTFTDNTTASISNAYNNVMRGVEYMELYNVPTGIEDLGIDAWMQANAPAKVLESYTVVMAGAIAMTQAFKYVVDYNYVEILRLLCFTNPFGVLEMMPCKGIGVADTTIETEKASTSALSLPETVNWKSRRENTMKVNCGFKTKAEMQWLADLLEATRAFEIINDKMVPIVFEKNSLTTVHDLDYLYSATIEYAYTHTETIEQA